MDIQAEVKDTVESVTVMTTITAGYTGAQLAAEYLVNPGSLSKLRINFSVYDLSVI